MSQPPGNQVTVTVARNGIGERFSGTDRRARDLRRFGEADARTREVRAQAADRLIQVPYLPAEQVLEGAVDMLVAEVPGTGVRFGMSYGLLASCELLLQALEQAIGEVERARPELLPRIIASGPVGPTDDKADADERAVIEFKAEVDERLIGERARLSEAYETGAAGQGRQRSRREFETAQLELFTDDTYMSLSPRSSLLGALR